MFFNKDVEDKVLLEYKDLLYKEIDFLTIYGNLSLENAYKIPSVRRKIFLNNLNYFKSKENEKINQEQKNATNNPAFKRINFK